MTIPQDFLDALEDMPAAKAFFATLDRRNLLFNLLSPSYSEEARDTR
ncbi:YdeI/OmpD-associated family protein [Bradyrhizobium sp. sGM-13]|nr:YdeI/OmpD-associated family protein [Bradyrhizobium sp. sGM-13]